MINLLVDEAYAFDYLSILSLKINSNTNLNTYERCCVNLATEIGFDLFNKIMESEEYTRLKKINGLVFDAVDLAREGKISAREVQELNYERYICKRELQNRFFNSLLVEQKI